MEMQKDFVNVVARAAAQKVSDIHVIVADSTQIMFRVNGMMQTDMEYNKDWGEAFVRAAFASADISDANYAQNEFQGAQKLGSTPLRGSKGRLMLPHNVLAIRLQFNPIAFGSQYLVMPMAAAIWQLWDLANTKKDFSTVCGRFRLEFRLLPDRREAGKVRPCNAI